MTNDNLDDKGQFKMRLDEEEAEDAPILSHVGDLRFEKLNTRVTMISILIPVLIVLVLVIAYLDIKKRVIQTEDTGQLTAESLSKELESRFSSLTMAQKVVEENLERLKDQSNKSVAKVQINLKKLDDRFKGTAKKMASQKDIKTTKAGLEQSMGNVSRSVDELKEQVGQMDEIKVQLGQISETLQPQISKLEKMLADNNTKMTQLEEQLSALDTNKIDKAKMGVALKIEMLKIKQAYKTQLEDLQSRLKSVERKIVKQTSATPKPVPSPTVATPKPKPKPSPSVGTKETAPSPAPSPSDPAPAGLPPGQLEEQTIGK